MIVRKPKQYFLTFLHNYPFSFEIYPIYIHALSHLVRVLFSRNSRMTYLMSVCIRIPCPCPLFIGTTFWVARSWIADRGDFRFLVAMTGNSRELLLKKCLELGFMLLWLFCNCDLVTTSEYICNKLRKYDVYAPAWGRVLKMLNEALRHVLPF